MRTAASKRAGGRRAVNSYGPKAFLVDCLLSHVFRPPASSLGFCRCALELTKPLREAVTEFFEFTDGFNDEGSHTIRVEHLDPSVICAHPLREHILDFLADESGSGANARLWQ